VITRVLAALFVLSAVGCGYRTAAPASGTPTIVLHPQDGARSAYIEVTGLSSAELASLRGLNPNPSSWQSLFAVTVGDPSGDALPPVQGHYTVTAAGLAFTPLFPFDPGRAYLVRFDPSRLPQPRQHPVTSQIVRLPALASNPTTRVTMVYPSGPILPENTLRLYIEFSAPMGTSGALDHVRLLTARGEEVPNPFLPVQADFWNAEHTRYTLFFDPGRVKQGILPNRQQGRPLESGQEYSIEISSDWHDANSQPLVQSYRRQFRAGPAESRPLAMSAWRIAPPAAGSRDPVIVTFPWPLDHGLLARALGVEGPGGRTVDGDTMLEADDTRWLFRPRMPWDAGTYQVTALSVLEDPAGNRIGRAFEVDMTRAAPDAAPEVFRTAFRPVAAGF
jgi:hypothetical protein